MRDLRHIEERQATTPIMGEILALFADGSKRTRTDASKALDISERSFRANVEKLNELGYALISEGEGFFLATEIGQIHGAKNRLLSAYTAIGKRIASLETIELEFIRRSQGTNQLRLI